MYVIIAGGGLVGKGLAERLVANKHDVIVIDKNQSVCEEIFATTGAIAVQGNASNLETLENAHIDKCEVAVATMREDADNLSFALLAKHFGVSQILVRMNNPKYEGIYKSIGVKKIARSTDLLIDQLFVSIETPELRKVIQLGNLEICIVDLPKNSIFHGKKIVDVVNYSGFPQTINVTAVFIDGDQKFIVPRGNTIIHELDRLFLCGSHADLKKAAKILQKVNK